jgi:mannose-6-phosphate isomerase-like protein (cupin superfamily)
VRRCGLFIVDFLGSQPGEARMEKVNVREKFERFNDYWNPKIAAGVNDSYIKLAKFKGEFVWHHHANEDELFFVIKGRLVIRLRDGEVRLSPGEFVVIPRGVEHLPIAEDEVHVILIEPKTTLNTGNLISERTTAELEKI